jgi:serine/threonine protein kinase
MAMRSLKAVHSQHVVHKDVRAANMLFSKETNSVMLIECGWRADDVLITPGLSATRTSTCYYFSNLVALQRIGGSRLAPVVGAR